MTCQYIIDLFLHMGISGFDGITDWHDLKQPIFTNLQCGRNQNRYTQQANKLMRNKKWSWLEIAPFPDVNFADLHSAMTEGDFHGHFLANRAPLLTKDHCSDPAQLTNLWLKKQNYGSFASQDIIASICFNRTAQVLRDINADFFLTTSVSDARKAAGMGISAWVINRPYNVDDGECQRVSTVAEFLDWTVYAVPAALKAYTNKG